MRFELFIAARYLRAKRRQAVVGVITAISVIGVAAGVASLIIALAITNGMRRDLQQRLIGSTAHVLLMRVSGDGIREDLAETIGAEVGDTVLVTSPQGELTPLGLVPKYQRYTVAGVFNSGF